MADPTTGREEGTGDEPVPSLRIPDDWLPLLWEMLNRLDYKQAEEIIHNADVFMEHVNDYWQAEAERHDERLAEEGRYGR